MEQADFTPIFVGGAWRSGTFLVQALLCTAEDTNDLVHECGYFSALANAVEVGISEFDKRTFHYFSSINELIDHHGQILQCELERIWRKFLKPKYLVLKDPNLTKHFSRLSRMLSRAWFVVIFREPRDVLASRIEVYRRLNAGAEPTKKEFLTLCEEYVSVYQAILENFPTLQHRLCFVEYERLVGGDLQQLKAGELLVLRPELVWENHKHRSGLPRLPIGDTGQPYSTQLYGGMLSTSSVGRYGQTLSQWQQSTTIELCGGIFQELRALATVEPARA